MGKRGVIAEEGHYHQKKNPEKTESGEEETMTEALEDA